MKYRLLMILSVAPVLAFGVESPTPAPKPKPKTTTTKPATTTTRPATKPATTKPTTRPATTTKKSTAPARSTAKPVSRKPRGPFESDTVLRFDLGYGITKEDIDYSATSSPDTVTTGSFESRSTSQSSSTSASSYRLDVGPMFGVHPASRGDDYGFIWGVDLSLAMYKKVGFDLPVADADVSATTQNGRTFKSDSTLQTFGIGPSAGISWDLSPAFAIEGLAFGHIGIMHAKYTSGENTVYGSTTTPSLFENDLYNLYYDLGIKVNGAYRFDSGWEAIGTLGYLFGQSFKGSISDSVRFYQGTNPPLTPPPSQTGSYKEQLAYKVSGPFITIGAGYSF
ncbi:MAG: hypothetical protein H0W83_09150 [Planctomycetes bacterium]|nr:hypothetical protein [Planctomycetota bacterium]